MNSPHDPTAFSMSEALPPPQSIELEPEETAFPARTDRLYQIATLAAGIIFLVTVL